MSNVDAMANADDYVTVPEAARRLRMPGGDVYRLLFDGVLNGGPSNDGAVYITVESIDQYRTALARQEPSAH